MWRFVSPAFEDRYRIVLFDHVGAGGSDLSAYDPDKYASWTAMPMTWLTSAGNWASSGAIFVGHSVSAMIGVLAANKAPELFESLVLVGPSPRYIDDGDYVGGFTEGQIEELLESLDSNHMGWSQAMAPVIMGNPDRPELGEELTNSFCRTDPEIAKHFARTTFLSDNRADLAEVKARTLILQCSEDVIAPRWVTTCTAIRDSTLVLLDATGHCPNLSAPEETIAAIRSLPLSGGPWMRCPSSVGREDLEDLYENAPCGYVSSTRGPHRKVNQTFLSWMGYEREQLVGRAYRIC